MPAALYAGFGGGCFSCRNRRRVCECGICSFVSFPYQYVRTDRSSTIPSFLPSFVASECVLWASSTCSRVTLCDRSNTACCGKSNIAIRHVVAKQAVCVPNTRTDEEFMSESKVKPVTKRRCYYCAFMALLLPKCDARGLSCFFGHFVLSPSSVIRTR